MYIILKEKPFSASCTYNAEFLAQIVRRVDTTMLWGKSVFIFVFLFFFFGGGGCILKRQKKRTKDSPSWINNHFKDHIPSRIVFCQGRAPV